MYFHFLIVVRVDFEEVSHEMQAGTEHGVCVVALGELEKYISVNLTVEFTGITKPTKVSI